MTPLKVLKTKVKAFKSTLGSAMPSERTTHASMATTDHINSIIEQVKTDYPELADALPQKFESVSFAVEAAGMSDHTFLDIEIVVDQVLALLELIEE